MAKIDAYKNFEFEQFIEDPGFKNWILSHTTDQDAFWKKFIAAYPEKEKVVHEARTFLQGTKEYFEQHGASEQQLQNRLQQTLNRANITNTGIEKAKPNQTSTKGNPHPKIHRKFQLFRWWAIAATIALVLGFLSWFWVSTMNSIITYATNFGEWKTIELPDGSTVKLNANSELSLPKNWEAGADREVSLKGEAFFAVSKKPATGAKFTVLTPDLEVEVLGTAFNVHTRGESTEVYLQEGKVKLEHGEKQTFMEPGDFVAYSAKKEKIIARHRRDNAEKAGPDSWKDGVIIFNKEDAFQILKKLEEIHGVAFEVKNETIYTKKYNVAVPMEDLKIVLPILEKSMNVKITQENNVLILE